MMTTKPATPAFHAGDEVILTKGTYQSSEGAHGVFLRLREDANWADVTGPDGTVSSHPVEWLAHAQRSVQDHTTGQKLPALRHDAGAVMRKDPNE